MTRWRVKTVTPRGWLVSVTVVARLWFDARAFGALLLGALAQDVSCEVDQ